jgi:uncharacterized damage-inducible protein DinB
MIPSFPETLRHLAEYNRRANCRLYDACGALAPSALTAERPAFFGSIFGTLNHILVGDRIWCARFEGAAVPSTGLDAILEPDLPSLRRARQAQDETIADLMAAMTPDRLAGTLAYVNNAGVAHEDPIWLLALHLFNHQTHHRGQVHDMLMQTDVPPPSLDMHRVMRP